MILFWSIQAIKQSIIQSILLLYRLQSWSLSEPIRHQSINSTVPQIKSWSNQSINRSIFQSIYHLSLSVSHRYQSWSFSEGVNQSINNSNSKLSIIQILPCVPQITIMIFSAAIKQSLIQFINQSIIQSILLFHRYQSCKPINQDVSPTYQDLKQSINQSINLVW